MSQNIDLRDWLQSWPYNPDEPARLAVGNDGREILQVRTPMGVEQYELDGRPDGRRPHRSASALDYQRNRLAKMKATGRGSKFSLDEDECAELFDEGVLYYYRYLHLFQLQDWPRVIRDTQRNLDLFDFVHHHARREEDQWHLEQWRPYLLRMSTVARAMAEWQASRHNAALKVLREGIAVIEQLEDLEVETFQYERERSLETLRGLVGQIKKAQPMTEIERLEGELNKAIQAEEFEKAATLRDQLRVLRLSKP